MPLPSSLGHSPGSVRAERSSKSSGETPKPRNADAANDPRDANRSCPPPGGPRRRCGEDLSIGVSDGLKRDADALHLLGVLLHQRGDHRGAIELIRKAVTIRPQGNFSSTWRSALRADGRAKESLDNAQRQAGDAEISRRLECFRQFAEGMLGRFDEAIQAFASCCRRFNRAGRPLNEHRRQLQGDVKVH